MCLSVYLSSLVPETTTCDLVYGLWVRLCQVPHESSSHEFSMVPLWLREVNYGPEEIDSVCPS